MWPIPPQANRNVGNRASRTAQRHARRKIIGQRLLSSKVHAKSIGPHPWRKIPSHSISSSCGNAGTELPAESEDLHIANEAHKAVTRMPSNCSGYATRFFRARSSSEQAPARLPVE